MGNRTRPRRPGTQSTSGCTRCTRTRCTGEQSAARRVAGRPERPCGTRACIGINRLRTLLRRVCVCVLCSALAPPRNNNGGSGARAAGIARHLASLLPSACVSRPPQVGPMCVHMRKSCTAVAYLDRVVAMQCNVGRGMTSLSRSSTRPLRASDDRGAWQRKEQAAMSPGRRPGGRQVQAVASRDGKLQVGGSCSNDSSASTVNPKPRTCLTAQVGRQCDK